MTSYRSLRSGRDIAATLRSGTRVAGPGFTLAARPGIPGVSRLGLAVKAPSAVRRNRIKRRLRAAWRSAGPAGLDVVARADAGAADAEFQELVAAFERVGEEMAVS